MAEQAVPLSSISYSDRSVKVDYLRGLFAIFVALGHLLAFLFALCLLKDERPDPSPSRRRFAALFGDASYPVFIMHRPVGILAAWRLNAWAVNDFYLRLRPCLVRPLRFHSLWYLFWSVH